MNKIDQNLHATGGHSGTISMRLAATRLQDKRQADKRCVVVCLYIIIIFLALASQHPRRMLPTIQLTILGYLVWKMCWFYGWHSHTEANFSTETWTYRCSGRGGGGGWSGGWDIIRLILKKILIAPFINYVSSCQTHQSRTWECGAAIGFSGNTYFDAWYSEKETVAWDVSLSVPSCLGGQIIISIFLGNFAG